MKTEKEIKEEIEILENAKTQDNYVSANMINSYIVALEWVLDNE